MSTRIRCTLLLANLDDQCITVRVTNVTCVFFTEEDIVRLTSDLFGRPLVRRACGRDRAFPGLSEVAVLGSSHFLSEVRSTKDSSDLARRSCLVLVLTGLGALVADVVLEVPLSGEFLISSLSAMHSSVVWPASR